ncbi:MAG: hypothetical protein WCA78_07910 [Rhizomicrobium sp.]
MNDTAITSGKRSGLNVTARIGLLPDGSSPLPVGFVSTTLDAQTAKFVTSIDLEFLQIVPMHDVASNASFGYDAHKLRNL